MKKLLSLTLIAATALAATATPLTPEQALAAARRGNASQMKRVATAPMELTYTMSENATPTLYVFTPAEGAGFLLLAADDAVPVMLGYSADSTFDADNIPDNVAYWLGQYSLAISMAVDNDKPRPAHRAPARLINAPSIAPLCKTQWNQGAPYNLLCPSVDGKRSVTGCVATATAQIMKVHRWPDRGEGSKTYTFDLSSASFNYGTTKFDWDNMLDRYDGDYTSAQSNAVATLMLGVGVAANMNYSPSASGAYATDMAAGLVEHLKYDESIVVLGRDNFTADTWEEMIYYELEDGRPVYYDGNNGSAGHAFVCDGFDGFHFFHINWGWGGYCDGYFLLSNLYPEGQGIGGGSGEEGFNYGQSAIFNLMPNKQGTKSERIPVLNFIGNIYTESDVYSTADVITIKGEGDYQGLYNNSWFDIEDLVVGVQLTNDYGVERYIEQFSIDNLNMRYGFYPKVSATTLPEGKWNMRIVAKCFNSPTWHPTYAPVANGSAESFDIEVTRSQVKIKPHIEEVAQITSTLVKMKCNDYEGIDELLPGLVYTLDYELESTVDYDDGRLCCVILDRNGNEILRSAPRDFSIAKGKKVSASFTIKVPNVDSSENYFMGTALVEDDDSLYPLDYMSTVTIGATTFTPFYQGWTAENGTDRGLYPGGNYRLNYLAYAPEAWEGWLVVVLIKDSKIDYQSDFISGNFAAGSMSQFTFDIALPESLAPGEYLLGLYGSYSSGDSYLRFDNVEVVDKNADGIETVTAAPAAPVHYYNMQGVEVANPGKGLYLRRQGNRVDKILIK